MGTSSRRHRRRTGLIAIAVLVPLLAVPARAEDPLDPYLGDVEVAYPNLVPNVAFVDVRTTREFDDLSTEEGMFLFFDTRAQNFGTVPIQVTIDEVETPETSTVSPLLRVLTKVAGALAPRSSIRKAPEGAVLRS